MENWGEQNLIIMRMRGSHREMKWKVCWWVTDSDSQALVETQKLVTPDEFNFFDNFSTQASNEPEANVLIFAAFLDVQHPNTGWNTQQIYFPFSYVF